MLSAFVSLTSENRGYKLKDLSAQQNEVCQLLHKQASMANAMGEGESSRLCNTSPGEGPRWLWMLTSYRPCTQAKLFIYSLFMACRSKCTTFTKQLCMVILKWGHSLSVPKSRHSLKAVIQVGAQCVEAAACLMSAFHCQRAPSHRGLEHGFWKISPSKLHLPTKKSNMIYGLFFQKLSLATVNCRGWKSFSPCQLQKIKSMLLLYMSYFSSVAPFGMVPVSSLSSLGAPSCPILLLSCFPQPHAQHLKPHAPLDAPTGPHPGSANTSCNTCAQTH